MNLRNQVVVRGNTNIRTGGSASTDANLGILPDFAAATFSDPLNIDNPYFPLVAGTTYNYEEQFVDEKTGQTVTQTDVFEVTNQMRTIDGVVIRVVHDRVFQNGLLLEDTLDFHARRQRERLVLRRRHDEQRV